ncbi:hypothetical protein PInf_024642 [Phytophthora infestans]|nr:hypothetical protein PInf_024642 [Phytophthora infestans]
MSLTSDALRKKLSGKGGAIADFQADDPPSSNEPSAESEPAAGFAPESELAITEPAVTESPKRKRRVTKRGAPAKKETKKPHRSTHNSAKQNQ